MDKNVLSPAHISSIKRMLGVDESFRDHDKKKKPIKRKTTKPLVCGPDYLEYLTKNLVSPAGVRSPYEVPHVVKNLIKDKVVVDLGCGSGDLSFGFSKYAKMVYGIEISSKVRSNPRCDKIKNIKLYKKQNFWEAIEEKELYADGDVYYVWGFAHCPLGGRKINFQEKKFLTAKHIKENFPKVVDNENRIILSFANMSDVSTWPFDQIIPFKTRERPIKKIRLFGEDWQNLCITVLRFDNPAIESLATLRTRR